MKRKSVVFISGPITPASPTENHGHEHVRHLRRGVETANRLLKAGFAVECPMLDFLYLFCLGGEDITVEMLLETDLEKLQRCDILFALPNVAKSRNVEREKEVAYDAGLVVWAGTLEELEDYGRERND